MNFLNASCQQLDEYYRGVYERERDKKWNPALHTKSAWGHVEDLSAERVSMEADVSLSLPTISCPQFGEKKK